MQDILDKLTNHSRNALKNAFGFALSNGHKILTPKHILLGLIRQKGSIAGQILEKANLFEKDITQEPSISYEPEKTLIGVDLSLNAQKLIEKSFNLASQLKHHYVGTEHLLLSAILINDQEIKSLFEEKKIDVETLKEQIEMVFNSTAKFPKITEGNNEFQGAKEENYFDKKNKNATNVLEYFGINLTDPVFQKKIDPLIGREDETQRLIQILCRRQKNNPLLLGDPGTGKTAIVEGLAKKICEGKIPAILENKKIFSIDISSVIAGTSFRGEFENRLKQIIQEAKNDPNVILFIDEIHNLSGAGQAGNSMDAANILKPALARGEIKCIGATTLDYYKKFIENDPAMERRFQPIDISQPSIKETIKILQGIKINYELFHDLIIDDLALKAAAELSERYIFDRFLPDKAIDLIDEACAAAKISKQNQNKPSRLAILEKKLQNLSLKKSEYIAREKFKQAEKVKEKETEIINQIAILKSTEKPSKENKIKIQPIDIARVVSKITGIPMDNFSAENQINTERLEKILKKEIFGQDRAIEIVCEVIARSKSGISHPKRPIGSFMFLGPTGVGKTELAKIIAQKVFGDQKALVKIDMSEFAESFNISKLIGAPAGYIGYKEGAKLTDAVKRRPYSVVLFDEIEKAHPQIFNLLLQVLEDGYLTDATGKTVNFRNTIIILTSNLGSENFKIQGGFGFGANHQKQSLEISEQTRQIESEVVKKIKQKFPPEFLSRLDNVIIFKKLDQKAIEKICHKQMAELKDRLAKNDIKISFGKDLISYLAKTAYSPEIGAREIRKMIQEIIEGPAAKKILNQKKSNLKILTENKKINIL